MSNVVEISAHKPVPEVIEKIENLLERAKKGEIRAVIFGYRNDDGTSGGGWMSDPLVQHDQLAQPLIMLTHMYGEGILQSAEDIGYD